MSTQIIVTKPRHVGGKTFKGRMYRLTDKRIAPAPAPAIELREIETKTETETDHKTVTIGFVDRGATEIALTDAGKKHMGMYGNARTSESARDRKVRQIAATIQKPVEGESIRVSLPCDLAVADMYFDALIASGFKPSECHLFDSAALGEDRTGATRATAAWVAMRYAG